MEKEEEEAWPHFGGSVSGEDLLRRRKRWRGEKGTADHEPFVKNRTVGI